MARARGRLILGINCAYHESAAALVRDGEVCFAIEEERLTRTKHAKTARVTNPDELPWNAIRACLAAAPGACPADLDAIAYSLAPGRRLALIGGDPYEIDDEMGFGTRRGEEEFNRRLLGIPQVLARAAGDETLAGRFHFVPHHRAHAASAFYASPFAHAAVLVVDGIGETATAWLGRGSPEGLEEIEEIAYPHSIGMLWERVAVYLGFTEFDACKVMGLAAYGDPDRFRSEYDRLFRLVHPDGGSSKRDGPPFLIDPVLARLRAGDVDGLESLFGPRRTPDQPARARSGSRMSPPACNGAPRRPCWLSLNGWLVRRERAPWFTRAGSLLTASPTPGSNVTAPFDRSSCSARPTMPERPIGAALEIAHQEDRALQQTDGPAPHRTHSFPGSLVRSTARSKPRSRTRAFRPCGSTIRPGVRHRCSRTARSWAGFKDAWSSVPGPWAAARCSRTRGAPRSAIRSIGESNTASRFDLSVRRFWPKMRPTGSRSRATDRGLLRAGTS